MVKTEETKSSAEAVQSAQSQKKSQVNEDINKLIKAEQAMAAKQQSNAMEQQQNALLMSQVRDRR